MSVGGTATKVIPDSSKGREEVRGRNEGIEASVQLSDGMDDCVMRYLVESRSPHIC